MSKQESLFIKQSVIKLLWIIPIEKVDQVLSTNKKTKDEPDEGFFDYQQRSEGSEDSFDNQENSNNFASISCKNSNAKGEYRSKFELDHLVKLLRNYLVTYRISFETLVDVVSLKANSNFSSELKKVLNLDENDMTLDNLLSHLRKIDYQRRGEESDDIVTSTKADFLKDMILLEKEVFTYKLREKSLVFPTHLQKNFEKVWVSRSRTVNYLSKIKISTKVIESYYQILKVFHSMFFNKAETNKQFLPWIISFKETIMMYDQREDIVKFLKHLEMVFINSDKRMDLVRILNIILEKSMPSKEQEENIDINVRAYRWLQYLMKDSEVSSMSLSLVNNCRSTPEVIESCRLISNLLKYGNHGGQMYIYNTLLKGFFTKDFFQYIKSQFGSNIQARLKELDANQTIALSLNDSTLGQSTSQIWEDYCETMSNILLMLKRQCDNCYLDFQNFLRSQHVQGMKDNPTSVDIVSTIAEYLPNIYRFYLSNRHQVLEDLLKSVINTLTEFVLGPCRENQSILIEHKRALETINCIINSELSLGNPDSYNESLFFKVELLSEAVIFIESLIVGNEDNDNLNTLLDSLDKDGLVNKLIEIYMTKVKGKKSELILDLFCHRVFEEDNEDEANEEKGSGFQSRLQCTDYYCSEGYRTKVDKLLVETGFKIFLIMQQFEDKVGDNPAILGFKYHQVPPLNRNSVIEEVLFGHSKGIAQNNLGLVKTSSLTTEKLQRTSGDKSEEDEKRMMGARQYLMTKISFFGNKGPKFKKRDRKVVSEHLKETHENEKRKVLSQEEAFRLQAQDIDSEFLDHYKRVLFNEARQFFTSYVASVEVLHKDEIIKVHFTIPYFCRYITRRIEEDIIWNTERSSDQERLEMFLSNVDKYEYQMKRRQSMSSKKLLYFFISNWRKIKVLAYIWVVLLNIVLLVSVVHGYGVTEDSDGTLTYTITHVYNNFSAEIKDKFEIPLIILEILQLVFCLINFILMMYESGPEIIFNEYLRKHYETAKKNQQVKLTSNSKSTNEHVTFNPNDLNLFKRVGTALKSFSNQYNLLMVVLSAVALSGYKLLYSLILLDLISLSRNLRRTVASFIRNYRLILVSALLILLLVYFLSVIGFEYFPNIFNRVCWAHLGSHRQQI
jgi:hypothetical protein